MLKIRLSRTGKKSQPSFRVVVQEHTAAIKGHYLESVGFYRPAINPKEFKVDHDRVKHWLTVGAQPSDSLAVLLKKNGFEGMEKFIAPRDKQRKKKKEEEVKAPAPAPAEATPEPAPAEAPVAEAAAQ